MSTANPLRDYNEVYRNAQLLDKLDDHLIAEFAPAFVPKMTKYIPHVPTERQRAFLLLDNQEALYGGAAGGGKSDALLMAALQYVDVPGYSALLLRRTYADLEKPGALIPRSHAWLRGTDAHWNGRRWMFPSGAILDFGYLDNDSDKFNYQSSEYQFIGFDELTQFQELWYRYMFSRTRRTTALADVPVRVRGASNPGGIGHEWVYRRFILEGLANGRIFMPAQLDDNPHLDQNEYDQALQQLDTITYQQYRHGDWLIKSAGAFFNRNWVRVLDEAPANARPIRMWDLAATKNQTSAYTAGALASYSNNQLVVHDMVRIKGDPGEVEETIKSTAQRDGRSIPIHIEQEPGSGGVNTLFRYQRQVLLGYAVYAFSPKHDKLTRATPLSALARGGGVAFVRGAWNGPALDEFEAFPNGFKDQVDACSASLICLSQRPEIRVRAL